MTKINELSFKGKVIYCGLDVHKTNWKINARMEGIEMAAFSQNPDPVLLKNYAAKNYPGAELKVVYEAGFCGFEIQRSLTSLGIECIVVNPADVPSGDKDRKRKDDKRDKTRCANRIKHLLLSNGIKTGVQSERLSLLFIKKIEQLDYRSLSLKASIKFAIEQYLQIRRILKEITLTIRNLSKQEPFIKVQEILQTIDGIGLINGMVIQTEIGDISRFKRLDSLCDYAGLVPDIYSSNDKMVVRGISKRRNEFLRETIIESSWTLIRKDPAMLMKYNEYRSRMNANKAIVRIAKHLLSRIRFLWKNEQTYVRGIVA